MYGAEYVEGQAWFHKQDKRKKNDKKKNCEASRLHMTKLGSRLDIKTGSIASNWLGE